jgi:uncharacterized protein (UPF0276 family)
VSAGTLLAPRLSDPTSERPSAARKPRRAGVGLRAQHHLQLLEQRPPVEWLEVHSENYFGRDSTHRRVLEKIRAYYSLSLHSVGLSLGSTDPLRLEHLSELAELVRDLEPMLVSEHLSWSSIDGRFTNDLLPLPYTEEALNHMVARVSQVQEFLKRQILIENVSSYLRYTCSQVTEWEFLAALVHHSGCGILLDVNNLYVSAMNHGFDACTYLAGIPASNVQEFHLAGHVINHIGQHSIRIDSHGAHVSEAVWNLYRAAVRHFGARPALIEWDTDIPALEVLVAEAEKADRVAEGLHAVVA